MTNTKIIRGDEENIIDGEIGDGRETQYRR